MVDCHDLVLFELAVVHRVDLRCVGHKRSGVWVRLQQLRGQLSRELLSGSLSSFICRFDDSLQSLQLQNSAADLWSRDLHWGLDASASGDQQ